MKKQLLILIILSFSNVFSQSISGSITGTFIEGISPVMNTITVSELQNTKSTIFKATNSDKSTEYASYTDSDETDGFNWSVEMGQFPEGTLITAEFFDAANTSLGNSDDLNLTIVPKPQWLQNGTVTNVSVNGTIISFEGNYPIYNYPYQISSSVKGIGGRSIDIAGQLIFQAEFDIANNTSNVKSNKAQIVLNILDQLPSYTKDIEFSSTCTLGNDLNLSFVISHEISTPKIEVNMPKIKFPIGGVASISVDAGVSLFATLKGEIVIGQDQGQWGFIDNGQRKTKIVGVLTGQGFIRGKVSVLGGVGSASVSLDAKARIGIGFEYVSVPTSNFSPIVGGDLNVWGEVCYKTFWGLGPSGCKELPSFYYDKFGDTSKIKSGLNSIEQIFNTQSLTYRDIGTLALPDFNPQPTFSTRGDSLYAVWLEHSDNIGHLLFSKLNSKKSNFSNQKIIISNENSISNPKIGILPSGSAIITWSQSRYTQNTIPNNASDENKSDAQDVWFAIYDTELDSVVAIERIGDDVTSLNSGRAEGEAKISIGDNNDAMITWVSKDASTNSSDIWYSHLQETADDWNFSSPAKLVDLSGTNYNVEVVYSDSVNALAVWINDKDGDEDTYDSELLFAEWNGTNWSNEQTLANNDGSSKLKELSLASNNGYISLAYTSTKYESDDDFKNRIDLEIYDQVTGDWKTNSHFEDTDSNYYFQKPQVSISNTGIATICYQVIDMFADTMFIDNGEIYLYTKDLNSNQEWKEIANNTFLCDTNTFIWELTAGFSGDNKFYTMTQEYNDNGVVTNPYHGLSFGDPNLSMVLRGVQINSDLSISDIPEPNNTPAGLRDILDSENFKFLNNYPNPFSQFTTIEFQLNKTSDVKLEIYNFMGVKVTELLNSNLSPGIYKTLFNAGNLSSGIYITKLTVDGQVSTGKLILNKE